MRSSHHQRQSRSSFFVQLFLHTQLGWPSLTPCVHWRRLASLEIAGRCCHASKDFLFRGVLVFPVSFYSAPSAQRPFIRLRHPPPSSYSLFFTSFEGNLMTVVIVQRKFCQEKIQNKYARFHPPTAAAGRYNMGGK